MKKIFAFAAAAIFALSMNAKQVVFDFTNPASLGANPAITPSATKSTGVNISGSTFTVDGVVMSSAKVNKSNDNKIFTKSDAVSYELRMYGDNTLTFTATENITAIEFAGDAIDFKEFTGKTWVGEALSVTVTANSTCKISSATLTIGEAAVIWTPDTISTAEAVELAKNGDKHDHFVIGVVHGEPFCTYAFKDKVSFWMHDAANAADTLEFYDGMGKGNEKWESLDAAKEELRIGDTILVYAGSLQPYHPKEAAEGVYIYEIAGGYYVEKLGSNPNPPAILGPDTITTAQALAIAKALAKPSANGQSTTDTKEYVIGGYAVQVYDKNSDGTWSFFMADEEGAYGEFQASNATTDKDVVKGDYMYLRGYIARRLTNAGKDQYQVYKGTAEHGEPLPMEITEVDVAHALEIGNALVLPEGETNVYAEGTYRVTGWVVSIPTGGSYDPEEGIESFYLSDDNTATRGDFLASQVSIDLEAQIGQQVAVVGRIQKHKSQSGNVSVQIFKGKATNLTRTGIENITLTEKAQKVVVDGVIYIVRDNKMFNLQGAQVR